MKNILLLIFISFSSIIVNMSAETINVNVTVSPMYTGGAPKKHIQRDIPSKDKSKLRKVYEKGGKSFRLYYEKRWYKPRTGASYHQEYMAKLRAKEQAYKILREEDYTRYGCEDNPKWKKLIYSVDYYARPIKLTLRLEDMWSAAEECWNYKKTKKQNKTKKTLELF